MFAEISYTVRILASASLLCLFLNGCREQREKGPDVDDLRPKQEFYIGISPERNIFNQRERFAPLAEYLSQKLNIQVELRMSAAYANLIDNLRSGELDAAFLGSFNGALAVKKLEAQPLVRPLDVNGTSTYRGLIFVRKDSGIATAQDMKGKSFVFVDKSTTAGWLFPLHFFKANGIDEPLSWLGETYFAGTHEDAILDVLNNKAVIGAAKDTIFYHFAEKEQRVLRELVILANSPPVPENTLIVSRETDASLTKRLQETLLAMHQDKEGLQVLEKFGAEKFIETSAGDYEPVFEYAKEVGVDLATYENREIFTGK